MELNYSLTEADFLDFQIYTTAKNPVIEKQRKRGRIMVIVVCLIIGGLALLDGRSIMGWYFLVAGVVCYIFYPKYLNYFYKRLFRKNVANAYGKIVPLHIWIRFDEPNVIYLDRGKTSTFGIDKIQEIIELDAYYYLKLSEVEYIIIPKSGVSNNQEVKNYLEQLTEKYSITYSLKLGWKWK